MRHVHKQQLVFVGRARRGARERERSGARDDARQRRRRASAAELRAGFPDRRDQAQGLRRDRLPARRAGLPVGLSGRFVRIHPGRGQALTGMDLNELVIADKFADAKGLWLTANDTTVYAIANVDLGKAGPVVVEVPPGAIVGLIDDFWQRSITDLGLPGPDGDKGGKFLLLPPGYNGEVPQTGYHVLKGTMNNYNVMVRGIVVNNDLRGCRAARQEDADLPVEASAAIPSRPSSSPCRAWRSIRFRRPASSTGRGSRRSSTTTPFRSATASSWPCSSRWASRRASRSSPTRGNARSSRTRRGSATRWAA